MVTGSVSKTVNFAHPPTAAVPPGRPGPCACSQITVYPVAPAHQCPAILLHHPPNKARPVNCPPQSGWRRTTPDASDFPEPCPRLFSWEDQANYPTCQSEAAELSGKCPRDNFTGSPSWGPGVRTRCALLLYCSLAAIRGQASAWPVFQCIGFSPRAMAATFFREKDRGGGFCPRTGISP